MSETERESIADGGETGNLVSVVELLSDPTKKGIVVLNADGTDV